ncbi:hypothetical protein ES705_26889 [subsurface metagenome]
MAFGCKGLVCTAPVGRYRLGTVQGLNGDRHSGKLYRDIELRQRAADFVFRQYGGMVGKVRDF